MQIFSEFTADGFKPHFSGHETFHIRHGWLEKAVRAVQTDKPSVFTDNEAIARFGVGKNMVSAIRHWATTARMITSDPKSPQLTYFGENSLGVNGVDPYLEHPSTLWMVHWNIATNAWNTTTYWLFNMCSEPMFSKDYVIRSLLQISDDNSWKKPSPKTLNSDVAVVLSNYSAAEENTAFGKEDGLASPLSELGLLRRAGSGDYTFNWSPKTRLSNGVFLYALCDFWEKSSNANTLSFHSVLLDAGSPSRVFCIDDNELHQRLSEIEEQSNGLIRWTESAGIRQLSRSRPFNTEEKRRFWLNEYEAIKQ